jgi:hypothetical protein
MNATASLFVWFLIFSFGRFCLFHSFFPFLLIYVFPFVFVSFALNVIIISLWYYLLSRCDIKDILCTLHDLPTKWATVKFPRKGWRLLVTHLTINYYVMMAWGQWPWCNSLNHCESFTWSQGFALAHLSYTKKAWHHEMPPYLLFCVSISTCAPTGIINYCGRREIQWEVRRCKLVLQFNRSKYLFISSWNRKHDSFMWLCKLEYVKAFCCIVSCSRTVCRVSFQSQWLIISPGFKLCTYEYKSDRALPLHHLLGLILHQIK